MQVRLQAPSQQFDAVGAIVYRHHFALGLAVLAADADVLVLRQMLVEKGDLVGATLLNAHHVGPLVVDHVDRGLLAVSPKVVAVGRGRTAHADVVGYDLDRVVLAFFRAADGGAEHGDACGKE